MDIVKEFDDYNEREYSEEEIWRIQSTAFKTFWKEKVQNSVIKIIPESDLDVIIRYLDRNAKGNNRNSISVAKTFIRMGMWYRVFKSLKEDIVLQDKFTEVLSATDDASLIKFVNELDEINHKNKNGLTGKNGVVLNALLFLNTPSYFMSVVSLAHRQLILKSFKFGDIDIYNSFGEKIIISNRLMLDGFKKLNINGSPNAISCFLYRKIKNSWYSEIAETDESIANSDSESEVTQNENVFTIEKYFEEFLIGNWETTDLGKKYDLIEKDDEIISQQYFTDIGRIDILAKEKNSDNYVVIELKRGQTSDNTVGQLARYMGWVKD